MSVDPAALAVFLGLGALFGIIGGVFGIGGGLVAIPVLGVVYGLDEQHAQGTSLVLVAPTMLLGLWNYARRGGFDRRVALALVAGGVPMTYAGAQLATHTGKELRVAFAAFLIVLAAYIWWRSRTPRDTALPQRALPAGLAALIGGAGGAISGLFGVGGAYVVVPLLNARFGFAQTVAQGLALAFVAPGALVSLVTYAHAGDVVWPVGLALAAGSACAVGPGVALAHRLSERRLQRGFCLLLVIASVALALTARQG